MSLIQELVGKFFSKEKHIQIPDNAIIGKVCYCGGKRSEELFPCFKEQCKYGKFHLDCLKLKNEPRRKWLCPDCWQKQLLFNEVSVDKIVNELDSSILIIQNDNYWLFFYDFKF